ncbi:MAG: hypothetical protein SGILL_009460 [Bacillariaceae sp.]
METLAANAAKLQPSSDPKPSSVKSPSKWYVACKSKSGSCIFFSWADAQKSQTDLSASDVELAAFPSIQQAEAFLEKSTSTQQRVVSTSTDSCSADTANVTHSGKKSNVPNVVVLSSTEDEESPADKRKLSAEDQEESNKKQKYLIHRVSEATAASSASRILNRMPATMEEYLEARDFLDANYRSRAGFATPAFANLVNAATAASALTATPPSSLAAYNLLNMSASASTALPRTPGRGVPASSVPISKKSDGFGWTAAEDMRLREIMGRYKKLSASDLQLVAKEMGSNRTAEDCQQRWTRYLKPGVRKGNWTEEEDRFIMKSVQSSAEQPFTRWSELAHRMPGRHGKQIRERWVNHLDPNINHLPFSKEDDLKLWHATKEHGKKWVEISAKYFNNTRAENQIKNRWYSAAFKKFIAEKFGPDAYGS